MILIRLGIIPYILVIYNVNDQEKNNNKIEE